MSNLASNRYSETGRLPNANSTLHMAPNTLPYVFTPPGLLPHPERRRHRHFAAFHRLDQIITALSENAPRQIDLALADVHRLGRGLHGHSVLHICCFCFLQNGTASSSIWPPRAAWRGRVSRAGGCSAGAVAGLGCVAEPSWKYRICVWLLAGSSSAKSLFGRMTTFTPARRPDM